MKYNKKTLSQLEKEADRLFSLWIRQRDANESGYVKCCTCKRIKIWRYMDCGHYISRAKKSTRYDEQNCAGQCKQCNSHDYQAGRKPEHAFYINQRFGNGTSDKLYIKSKMACKRTRADYIYLIEEIKQKLIENNFKIR